MAAGLGFKTFTTGEVLTAADVNGYLMQGVLVFASAAARTTAITSPQEGQYSFLKDTNALEYYDGAAWVGAPVGDITAVTAGTGISGGGSSGAVTITNSMATEIDAKGDLVVGTGADTFARLAVGANDLLLTAASGETTGLKYTGSWEVWTPSTGGITLGNGTITARYIKIGKFVNWYFRFTLGSTSAVTGLSFSLPITVSQSLNFCDGMIYDIGVAGYRCYGEIDGSTVYGRVSNSAGTYTTGSLFSATVPMTWGTGDVMIFTGSYEVA
jgi:hypothetical protein